MKLSHMGLELNSYDLYGMWALNKEENVKIYPSL